MQYIIKLYRDKDCKHFGRLLYVEAQKDEPQGYDILNRAIFYISRLISSQKERDFQKRNYDDIRRVYSIWVCMNMEENSLCHIHLVKDDLVGCHDWKGNLDLLNIVMIGLAKELPEHNDLYELHRLLGALFSQELTQNEREAGIAEVVTNMHKK